MPDSFTSSVERSGADDTPVKTRQQWLGTVEFAGRAIAITIRDSALLRHLIADIVDCCTVHLLMSAGVDAVVLVVSLPIRYALCMSVESVIMGRGGRLGRVRMRMEIK